LANEPETETKITNGNTAEIQKAIYAFISTDILHRRTIEQWANDAGMHRSQHRMLLHLSKCESTPSQKDLAEHFDISPAAVAVTLKKLESGGYIERGKCTERADSRYNEIRITDRGRLAAEQSRKYFHHVDCQALKDFSDAELEQFRTFLERMQNNLKQISPLPSESDENFSEQKSKA
jgi:DNA-binding MarR family transcriptional regulator